MSELDLSGEVRLPSRERVAVVVTTYNRQEMLRRCLTALLACPTGDHEVEVVIVDDGSQDNTGDVVREIIAAYSGPMRLRYVRQENGGHSAAVNRGVRETDTEVVLILDDDCLPDPGWLLALVNADWSGNVAAVGGKIVGVEKGNVVSRYCRHIGYNEFPRDERQITFVNSGNSAYLRRALDEVNGFEDLICLGGEDIELSWRLVKAGYRLVYQPEAVVLHFHRETYKALVRTFWTRGYSKALRNVLWGSLPYPKGSRWIKEFWRLLAAFLRLPVVLVDASRLRAKGVPAADALPFAYFDYLNSAYSRHARVTCLWRIARGTQTLRRTSVVPEGAGDPSLAPGWAAPKSKASRGPAEEGA